VNINENVNAGGDCMEKLSINSVPEPFREFLKPSKTQEISAMGLGMDTDSSRESTTNSGTGGNDMQDLLFLAAILMLCDNT